MLDNPWHVKNVQNFLFLNCPECEFKTKKENIFHNHAVQCHPSSILLFSNENEYDPLELKSSQEFEEIESENFVPEDLQNEETLEDIMFPEEEEIFNSQFKPTTNKVIKSKKDVMEKSTNEKSGIEQKQVFHFCSFCSAKCESMENLKIHIKRHQNVLPMAIIRRVLLGFEIH